MKIFVITKKMLIIAAAVIFVVAAAVIIALSFSDGAVSPTSAMAQLEEYELEVLAGKKKELPVKQKEEIHCKNCGYDIPNPSCNRCWYFKIYNGFKL